jgi:ribose transport system ATP-binding protein
VGRELTHGWLASPEETPVPGDLTPDTDSAGPALIVTGVVKTFGATKALRDVSLAVRRGEVHALLGGNGSGKSTLIKILAGVHSADAGTVTVGSVTEELSAMTPALARRLGFRFVHQQSSVFPDLSVTENLFLGRGTSGRAGVKIPWRALRRRATAVLRKYGIKADPDDRLGDLGPATQTIIAIARALDDDLGPGGVLILDEPTASLPRHEVEQLLADIRRLAAAGATIIFVTHRLEEVLAVADTISVLRDGVLVGSRSRAELDHESLVEMIMGRKVARLIRPATARVATEEVLQVTGLQSGPLKSASFTVRAGEIVGVAGLLGSGRSTLLRALFGLVPFVGEVTFKGAAVRLDSPSDAMAAGIAHVPEDRASEASFPELSVLQNITMATTPRYIRGGMLRHGMEAREGAAIATSCLVKAESVHAPMGSLSGGNQQKVVLARWLSREPGLLLLDEPSQGVDVGSRFEIWELVRRATAQGAAVLVVSSDLEELAGVCDRVLLLRAGRVDADISGNALTEAELERLTLDVPMEQTGGNVA